MDSTTHLDFAVFQLTPTRTRCDLVICSGKTNEKLASGLLEPFVSHLKSAKDQISKGGYSITLRSDASWFTKATLERFVRFVSTPEVLERFVTLEKEIAQIEKSIQSNEAAADPAGKLVLGEGNFQKSSTTSFPMDRSADSDNTTEENSKIRLQRVLETRKAVLCKEQAMAYARALVAGFELEYIDDLLYFADAFGAYRLREACVNFMNLCKEKSEDRRWMDEIAAMKAFSRPDLPSYLGSSGIMLAGEDNDPSHGQPNGAVDTSVIDSTTSHGSFEANHVSNLPIDGKHQMPFPWPNHLQQYMNNFQGPIFPQMPPYAFPGIQVPSSYFPKWPSNVDSDAQSHKSSPRSKKKQLFHKKFSKTLKEETEEEEESSTEGSDSSRSDKGVHDGKRRGKRSSSKTVVIRNINYIASERDRAEKSHSSEGSSSDEDNDFKHQVEKAVESLHSRRKGASSKKRESKYHRPKGEMSFDDEGDNNNKHHKNGRVNTSEREVGSSPWDAFQSLLLRDEEPAESRESNFVPEKSEDRSSFARESESKSLVVSDDSFLIGGNDVGGVGSNHVEEFVVAASRSGSSVIKKREDKFEDSLFMNRVEVLGTSFCTSGFVGAASSSTVKIQHEGDWFLGDQASAMQNRGESSDLGQGLADSAFGGSFPRERDNLLVDDSFMIEGRRISNGQESDYRPIPDIRFVPDIMGTKNTQKDSSQESNFEPDDLYMMLDRNVDLDPSGPTWTPEMVFQSNVPSKDDRRKSDVETIDGDDESKLPSKGATKRREARPKPVNGSLMKNKPGLTPRTTSSAPGSRAPPPKNRAERDEENRRRMEELRIQRQRRIAERSADNGLKPVTSKKTLSEKRSPITPLNSSPSPEAQKLAKPVLRSSTIDRLSAARIAKKVPSSTNSKSVEPTKTASMVKKNSTINDNKPAPKKTEASKKKVGMTQRSEPTVRSKPEEHAKNENLESMEVAPPSEEHFKDIKELEIILIKDDGGKPEIVAPRDATDSGTSSDANIPEKNSPLTVVHKKAKSVQFKTDPEVTFMPSPVPSLHNEYVQEVTSHLVPSPENLSFGSVAEAKYKASVPQISRAEIEVSRISTPPPGEGMSPEGPLHSRRKWNSEEKSPKASKGFRKLLFFGRKSSSSLKA